MRSLTTRELQIARLIAKGLTRREIGERLGISPETVKNLVGSAYSAIGARNAAHLVALLDNEGLDWRA